MKQILLPVILLLTFHSLAQRIYSPEPSINMPYLENEGESWVKLIQPERKIRSVTWAEENKRYNSYYCLDEQGFLQEIKHNVQYRTGLFLKNRFEHKKFTYTNGLASKIEFLDKKGKLRSHREFEHLANYKIKVNRIYSDNKLKA
ncbi:MAG TPA: hypothetical protein PLU73_09550, partial [Bacteroidia bacterium]|nr:hypothetical protein [Bacteroidia bacterium]